jgi:hypothetical protein
VEALRRDLRSQLQPTTVLQGIALEEIVCCTWRCKLATRQEMQHLSALHDIPRDGEPQPLTQFSWQINLLGTGRFSGDAVPVRMTKSPPKQVRITKSPPK